MTTILDRKSFFRLKAAMHDLIDRAGGIDRAAELCGYSRSAVGRWHCRHSEDLMPIAAVMAMETETGAPLVTRAMCGLHGLDCANASQSETHVVGAYVQLTATTAALNSEVASAMADGVITPGEQTRIDEVASEVDASLEKLRGSLASAGGKPLKVVGV
jgi:hypothetical protein